MPMMIEDYDDLFTDPLSLTPSPPPKGLHERLDELRSNGATQKVVWSKLGCIAYITADGKEVRLAHLQNHRSDGSWRLNFHTDPALGENIQTIYRRRQLANVSWSPTGSELLVSDIYGRLTFCTTFTAINRMAANKVWVQEPDNHMSAIIGLVWLNPRRQYPFHHSAMDENGQWKYVGGQVETKGPFNPWATAPNKNFHAFFLVTRSGQVKFEYQTPDNRWHEVKNEIDEVSTSDEILTHAAFSTDEGRSLLLAVHTVGKKLRLYRVTIDWQVSPGKDQAGSLPKVTLQHLETVDEFQPAWEQNNLQSNIYMMPSFEAQLSHLELLPPAPDMLTKENTLPTILATFSYLPPQYNGTEAREQPFSIISRWELRSEKWALHSTFMSLTSKKTSSPTTLKEVIALRRLEDVRLDRIVVQIQLASDNITLVIAYSDGSVEFRDRTTLQNLPMDDMPNKATSLPQIGFRFGTAEPCLHMALSQHRCIKVFFGSEHEPKMSFLQPEPRDIEVENFFSIEKARAAFTLHQLRGAILGNNPDDVLATMHNLMTHLTPSQTDQLTHGFVTDSYNVSLMNFDRVFDVQNEKILGINAFQRGLSLQSALGDRGPQVPRSVSSKLAWLMLNIRMMGLDIFYAFQNSGVNSEGTSDLNKPEILQTFHPLTTWSTTLSDHLTDDLFALFRALPPHPTPLAIRAAITASASPTMPLLLASTSRTLLKHLFRGLRGLYTLTSGPDRRNIPSCAALTQIFTSAAISPAGFEHVILEVDTAIKSLYDAAAKAPPSSAIHISDTARAELERDMVVTGTIPAFFDPVLVRLVTGIVQELRNKGLQEGELYFSNFYHLGIGAHPAENEARNRDGRRAVCVPIWGGGVWSPVGGPRDAGADKVAGAGGWGGEGGRNGEGGVHGRVGKNGKAVGVVRVGGKEIKLRRCARCAAVMEDVPQTRERSGWIANLQRLCFCGGVWVM